MNNVFWVSYAVLWVVVAIQSFAFLELLRQIAALRRRVGVDQGASLMPGTVETGALLPELIGELVATGREAGWQDLLSNDIGVAVFVSPRCPTCHKVAEGLATLRASYRDVADVVVVVDGPREEVLTFLDETRVPTAAVIFDEAGETAKRVGISVAPAAMTIRERRIGVAGIVNDAHQVEALLLKEQEEPSVATEPSTEVPEAATV